MHQVKRHGDLSVAHRHRAAIVTVPLLCIISLMSSVSLPAEEDRSCEDTGSEGALEGEKGCETAKERRRGDGERGKCPADGGSPRERLPSSCPAGAGEDE